MSAPRPEPNYSALVNEKNPFREEAHSTDNEDNEDTPRNSGVMIHIVPETSKGEYYASDLGRSLTSCVDLPPSPLEPHRGPRLVLHADVRVPPEAWVLCDYAGRGVPAWTVRLRRVACDLRDALHPLSSVIRVSCSDHRSRPHFKPFFACRDVPPITNSSKVTIPDVIVPGGECMRSFGALTWFTLIMTGILLFFRLVRVCYHIAQFWDIKKFFNTALKIEDVRTICGS